ncbi:related to cAMP-independent regulatory protein [Cephalotrichum gorgonifer]|uniref:Related to cAMP-independent regulatory protein n=1 Tax=Cephalotrichum gorgonifer TaxID=2041049 RepID=A0AAE8N8L0_9PEZI|nr:related to cAMP-independent regulatory protein [Cephalotrichum gorgonifer]
METYYGLVRTPADAIKLFEACRLGVFPRVQRRLSEKERQSIRSGSVFVWDEREAGMRRWTDGKSWSASRVSGSFLTYREMEGKRGGGFGSSRKGGASGKTPDSARGSDEDHDDGEPEGYRYKADGLMKQSFSITTSTGQHLHLISYFTKSHSQSNELPQPATDPQLRHLSPAKGLYPESSWSDTSAAAPALARAAMTTGQYIMPQPQPQPQSHHPHQQQQQQMHRQYPPHPSAKHHNQPPYSWPLSPVTTPPYSSTGTHYSTAPPYASQEQQQQQHQHPHQIPPPNNYPGSHTPTSGRLPPPAMLLHQQHQSHLPPQPHYPSPMTPHHSQPPPTPQYAAHSQASYPPTSRPLDSPRVHHLQAAAAQAVTSLAPSTTTTPPPRNLSVSPPRSARSDTASGTTTSYATSTPSSASNKPSLSALLLHPVGSEAGGSPRPTGCSEKGMTEDARALRVLDRKFCI